MNQPENLRFLSQSETIEAGTTNAIQCVDRMERVFELYHNDQVVMGEHGHYLHGHMTTFPSGLAEPDANRVRAGSRFGAMPAYVGGDIDSIGVKWYGSVTARSDEDNPPQSGPILMLSDPETGRPLALMDATVVSSMRTGAMAALGAKHIQGDHATTAAILGPGATGQASALSLDGTLESLEQIRVYHPEMWKAEAGCDALDERTTTEITPVDSLNAAVSDAGIVVASASRPPALELNVSCLAADSTVIQLGDLDVDLSAFDDNQVICDVSRHPMEFERQVGWTFTRDFTDMVKDGGNDFELSDVRALHEIVGGADTAPTGGRSIFSSLGLPMEDVAWGSKVYRTAAADDIGRSITVQDASYFSKPC